MAENNDELRDLVIRAQLGDRDAYQSIYDRFINMAIKHAFSILGDRGLAEDASQEAFLDAYFDLLSLRDPALFPAWFKRLVRNRSYDLVRGRRILTVPLEAVKEPSAGERSPAQQASDKQLWGYVVKALAQLPEHERETVQLFYLEQLTQKEIRERLSISIPAIKNRLLSARARLQQRMMEMVKNTVRVQPPPENRAIRQAATDEAVEQFDDRLNSLLLSPEEERQALKQQRQARLNEARNLLCAKGRLQRFMGRMDEALASFNQGFSTPALYEEPFARATFQAEMGLTYTMMADYRRARKFLKQARLLLEQERPHSHQAAAVLNGLGICAWGLGDFRLARKSYQEAVRVSKKAGSEVVEAEALNNLALLDWKSGRLEQSLNNFRACLERWRKVPDRYGIAAAQMHVGLLQEQQGRYVQARRNYREALKTADAVNFVQVQTSTHCNLSNIDLVQKRWIKSLENSDRALDLARRTRDRRNEAIALENKALAYLGQEQLENAGCALARAFEIAEKTEDRERLFSLKLVDIEKQLNAGDPAGICVRLDELLTTLKQSRYVSELPRLLRLRAWAEWQENRTSKAQQTIKKALAECRRQKNKPEETRINSLATSMGVSGGVKKRGARK